jgi:hypothetical protein
VFCFLRFLARSFPSRSRVRTHAKQANAACLPPHSQTLTRTYLPHSYRPTYKARYFPTYYSAFYKRGRFTHTHTPEKQGYSNSLGYSQNSRLAN